MPLQLYAHPFSSYCQKVLIALYENGTAFEFKLLDGTEPVASEFAALWPIGKFPLLADGDRVVHESTRRRGQIGGGQLACYWRVR